MNEPHVADALAEAAVAPIESGMIVGLGTGRTARRGIIALGDRVRQEKLSITCVPTSDRAEALACEHGLSVVDFATTEKVDYLFDGADEVDAKLRMLKGAGGAVTRERMVAWASEHCVYMVQDRKVAENLGTNATLSIAVMAFGLASIRAELHRCGLTGVVRRTMDGELFVTDNGNLILDMRLEPDVNVEEIADLLNSIPGVIDHGLFLEEADELLIESDDGSVRKLERT